ncbi:hypothetical protein EKO23_08755 [Nocardioides guangzhouensis]|uniref:Exo-alpha-sialidase n=1 Tax=Nocardioides guangzhouensis TaxID=2497878 RepID=A0A4Q4ZFX8_9ACTN|nr:hypothetical protein [Nocardioides guangzhouensis]RYP86738.1 hypothetical protein EKO23_08755 [Nocardioides guangzhouensis]
MGDPDVDRHLGQDGDGNQTVVMTEEGLSPDGDFTGTYEIMTATRPVGGDWSPAAVVSGEPRFVSRANLVVGRDGAAAAVWVRGVESMFLAYRAAGTSEWGEPERVIARGGYAGEVGIDDAGNVVVAYADNQGAHARRRSADGTWSAWRDFAARNVGYAKLAVGPGGEAVLVWERYRGYDVVSSWAARMSPTGAWQTRVRIPAGGAIPREGLAVDGRGRAVAAWWNARHDVRVLRSRPDGSWRHPRTIARAQQKAPGGLPDLKVATNLRGDVFVVWLTRRDIRVMRGRLRPTDGPWSAVRRISPATIGPGLYAIAVGDGGEAAVTWMRGHAIEARRLTRVTVP